MMLDMSNEPTTRVTHVRLPSTLLRAVEREARRTERTVSAIVRLALAEWIAAQRQNTQRSA
jgi:predicted transcriptional regulator